MPRRRRENIAGFAKEGESAISASIRVLVMQKGK